MPEMNIHPAGCVTHRAAKVCDNRPPSTGAPQFSSINPRMSFLLAQSDYTSFLYGLVYVTLGSIAFVQKFVGDTRIRWFWLSVFGLLHGLHEWFSLAAASLPETIPLDGPGSVLALASFGALVEFARANRIATAPPGDQPRRDRPLVLGAIVAVGTVALLLTPTGNIGPLIRIVALWGGFWTAWTLWTIRRETGDHTQRGWLTVAAWSIGAFSLSEGVFAAILALPAVGGSGGAIAEAVRTAALETVGTALVTLTALAVWSYIKRERALETRDTPDADGSLAMQHRYTAWLLSSLVVVLAVGWYVTERLGINAEENARDRSQGATEILASQLRDEMARTDLMAALLARSPYVQTGLAGKTPETLADAEAVMRQHTALLETSTAFLMRANGEVLASSETEPSDKRVGENFGFLPFFQDSSAYGLVGKDLAVEPDVRKRGYYVSHPVSDGNGAPIGIAVVKKVLAQSNRAFKDFRNWFLVSPNGIVFLSSRPEFLLKPLWPIPETTRLRLVRTRDLGPGPFNGALLTEAPKDRAAIRWDSGRALVNMATVRNDGWQAIIIEDLSEVALHRFYGILVTMAVALFTLCFFVVIQREGAYERRLASNQRRLQTLNAELERQATTDPLTGVFNRAKFNTALLGEIDRAHRYDSSFALIILDVDHFKRINDTWGHQTGDHVLVNLARVARDTVRKSDTLARWGGEEFVILLPMTDIEGTVNFATRVQDALARFAWDPVPAVTCSFGVTAYVKGDTLESVVHRADLALYAAKEGGRNRVEVRLGA